MFTHSSAPPPYEYNQSDVGDDQNMDGMDGIPQSQLNSPGNINSPNPDNQHDPNLSPSSKLPTYEEVQMEKTMLGELPISLQNNTFPIHGRIPPPSHPVLISALRNAHSNGTGLNGPPTVGVAPNGALTFIAIDTTSGDVSDGHSRPHSSAADNSLLGTDIMFVTAFLVAFLFNWIGFLMLTCFFHTIAARYGALSGFGLSLAKWTLIVKHSTDLASHENSWLWWLIMAFGFLICVRALVQYISIKRTWRLLSASAQERLLFFY